MTYPSLDLTAVAMVFAMPSLVASAAAVVATLIGSFTSSSDAD